MSSAFTQTVKALVTLRAEGKCDRCGTTARAPHFHHRRARGMGGTVRDTSGQAANCLYLHPKCHEYIESNRFESKENGWLLTQDQEPAIVPAKVKGHWAVLHDDGRLDYLSVG